MINFYFGLIFLIVFSILDFLTFNKKSGYIPSLLTTVFLLISLILVGKSSMFLIFIMIAVALFFAEQEVFAGIADLKILVSSGILFPSLVSMLVYATIVSLVSFSVKYFILIKITKGKDWKFPFIPVMLIAYVLAWMIT
jgi:hypothetical protein